MAEMKCHISEDGTVLQIGFVPETWITGYNKCCHKLKQVERGKCVANYHWRGVVLNRYEAHCGECQTLVYGFDWWECDHSLTATLWGRLQLATDLERLAVESDTP